MTVVRDTPGVNLPPPPGGYSQSYMSNLLEAIRRSFRGLSYVPVSHVYLVSPDGTVYHLSVDNTGTLVVAAAQKSDPRPPA